MNVPVFIGLRYTFSRHEQKFISFVSLISLLGTILGVCTMVLVLSVMNGFDKEIKHRLLAIIPHAFVENKSGFANWQRLATELEQEPGILAVAPWVEGKGLISFNNRHMPIQINGVDPVRESQVSLLAQRMLLGDLAELDNKKNGIVLGQTLARRLNINIGDKVALLLPDIVVSPVGVYPRKKSFEVIGVFRTGAEPDAYAGMIALSTAQKLFVQSKAVNRLRIRTVDIHKVEEVIAELRRDWRELQTNRNLRIKTWADTHRSLFAAIKMEKRMISLLLFSVIAVAVFNVISILTMMVVDKSKEIAILRVMGADSQTIMWCFIVQGMVVSLLGILVGAVLGSFLAIYGVDILLWLEANLLSGQQFYYSHLPSDWRLSDVLFICCVALLMSGLATVYPARKSAQINPVTALNS